MYQLGQVSNSDSDDECGSEKKEVIYNLLNEVSGSRVRRPKASIVSSALGLHKNMYITYIFTLLFLLLFCFSALHIILVFMHFYQIHFLSFKFWKTCKNVHPYFAGFINATR